MSPMALASDVSVADGNDGVLIGLESIPLNALSCFAVKLAVQVVVSNAKRIRDYLRHQREEELNPTPPWGGRPRKKRPLDIFEIAWFNAPARRNSACIADRETHFRAVVYRSCVGVSFSQN